MRKIFLDLGGHDGCSVRKFRNTVDTDGEYLIYSFEVDSSFFKYFKNFKNHTFINKAAWIKDGKEKFYKGRDMHRSGGTLFSKKKSANIDLENPITVDTIDFSKWVLDNFSKDDYIILKMDIEGAEYKVIPKMMEDGSFDFIDKLWIEWHAPKIRLSMDKHEDLVSKITIPIKKWNALDWCKIGQKGKKMSSKRYKFSRYAMYKHIEDFLNSRDLEEGQCLLVGDSIKGKGDKKIKIKNTAIIDMLPKGCKVDAPCYPDVDIMSMPYEDNTFDYVIADQVLEHVRKPWIAVEEVRRVLKPGGLSVVTSVLMFPVHGVPEDYWRFTPDGLKVLFENFSKVHDCRGTGNLEFAITCLKGGIKGKVKPGTDIEKKALGNDNKHIVSVWIIAEK